MDDSFILHAFKRAGLLLAVLSRCESNITKLLMETKMSALFLKLTCQWLDEKERIRIEENANTYQFIGRCTLSLQTFNTYQECTLCVVYYHLIS